MRLIPTTLLLATLAAAALPAFADSAAKLPPELSSDKAILLYLQLKDSVGKMPGVRKDGIAIKRDWLLDTLRKDINRKNVSVEDLKLTPEKGTLLLKTTSGVSALHTVDFRFLPVDWPNRTIKIRFERHTTAADNGLIAQTLGNIAIGIMGLAVGNPVEKLADKQPWAKVDGDVLSVRLDQVPSLADKMKSNVAGYPVFDYVGIRELRTADDEIRVKLGWMK